MSEQELSEPVKRLVRQKVCSIEDIREAEEEARNFSKPEMSSRIREVERNLDVLGDSTRLKIVLLLIKREMCVCEIEAALKLTQPTASHHLGMMERSGILERNRKARRVFYKLNRTPLVAEVIRSLKEGAGDDRS